MILEIDAGNTRIKWRLREAADGLPGTSISEGKLLALQNTPAICAGLAAQIRLLPLAKVSRVLVASVKGVEFNTALSALMTGTWGLHPEFAVVTAESCGVVNGYAEPGRLGVDRWLAAVAAYCRTRNSCCVVDCGTTITVDLVGAGGRHLGGYIVPGLRLMLETLAGRSQALAVELRDWDAVEPGTSTGAAIQNGILAMTLGFLQQVRQRDGQQHRWLLTGGDAHVLSPLLGWEHELLPDLVLDGLALTMLRPAAHVSNVRESS